LAPSRASVRTLGLAAPERTPGPARPGMPPPRASAAARRPHCGAPGRTPRPGAPGPTARAHKPEASPARPCCATKLAGGFHRTCREASPFHVTTRRLPDAVQGLRCRPAGSNPCSSLAQARRITHNAKLRVRQPSATLTRYSVASTLPHGRSSRLACASCAQSCWTVAQRPASRSAGRPASRRASCRASPSRVRRQPSASST